MSEKVIRRLAMVPERRAVTRRDCSPLLYQCPPSVPPALTPRRASPRAPRPAPRAAAAVQCTCDRPPDARCATLPSAYYAVATSTAWTRDTDSVTVPDTQYHCKLNETPKQVTKKTLC